MLTEYAISLVSYYKVGCFKCILQPKVSISPSGLTVFFTRLESPHYSALSGKRPWRKALQRRCEKLRERASGFLIFFSCWEQSSFLIPASLVLENGLLNNYFFFSVGFLWLWHFCTKLRRQDDVRGPTKPVLCTAQEKKCAWQISSQVNSQKKTGSCWVSEIILAWSNGRFTDQMISFLIL